MMDADPAGPTDSAAGDDAGAAVVHSLAEWLGLAAAPAFAVMALLAGVAGGGSVEVLCSAEHGSPLHGMVPMYLLMSAFHTPPWLKLMSGRRRAAAGHGRAAVSAAR
jgi:hypothetical protein